jgi:uncharacterized protein (TIGR03790 family)
MKCRQLQFFGFLFAALLQAQSAINTPLNERVMVVYNSAEKDSRTVANYYMERRSIPKSNLCKIDTSPDPLWDGERYGPEVRKPIRACLEKLGKNKILYIVMSYLTPYAAHYSGNPQSIDQALADIWDEYAGQRVLGKDAGNQPYFGEAQSEGNGYQQYLSFADYRDQPYSKTIYSVWRLDAATLQLAKGLVDKAIYAETNGLKGKAYFDIRGPIQGYFDSGYGSGEWDIYRASRFSKKAGFEVVLDEKETEFGTAPSLAKCENVALYAGWYSLQHYNDAFGWAPGAIGFHTDSASATDPRKPTNWVAGAVMKGITITSGSVTEPYLDGLVHPDQIFYYLFQGANAGDAVLRGTRWLKWMLINVGDPLYRPFPQGAGPYGSTIYHESWLGLNPTMLVGSGNSLGTLSLGENAEKAVPVAFKSTNPELITLPPSSTIPATGNGARFQIVAKTVKEPTNVRITVTVGNEILTNTLSLYPLLMDVSFSQPSVKSAGTATGTVSLYVAASGQGVTAKLSSSNPHVIVPSELKIPAGSRQATFPIAAKESKAEIAATITANIDGAIKTAQLKVIP